MSSFDPSNPAPSNVSLGALQLHLRNLATDVRKHGDKVSDALLWAAGRVQSLEGELAAVYDVIAEQGFAPTSPGMEIHKPLKPLYKEPPMPAPMPRQLPLRRSNGEDDSLAMGL